MEIFYINTNKQAKEELQSFIYRIPIFNQDINEQIIPININNHSNTNKKVSIKKIKSKALSLIPNGILDPKQFHLLIIQKYLININQLKKSLLNQYIYFADCIKSYEQLLEQEKNQFWID